MPLVTFTLCPLLCLHSTICYVYTTPLVMLALTLLLLVWVVVGGGGLGGGLGGGWWWWVSKKNNLRAARVKARKRLENGPTNKTNKI